MTTAATQERHAATIQHTTTMRPPGFAHWTPGEKIAWLENRVDILELNIAGIVPKVFGNGGTGAPARFAGEGTLSQQAASWLKERGTPATVAEMASALQKAENSIYVMTKAQLKKPKHERDIDSAGGNTFQPAGGF